MMVVYEVDSDILGGKQGWIQETTVQYIMNLKGVPKLHKDKTQNINTIITFSTCREIVDYFSNEI